MPDAKVIEFMPIRFRKRVNEQHKRSGHYYGDRNPSERPLPTGKHQDRKQGVEERFSRNAPCDSIEREHPIAGGNPALQQERVGGKLLPKWCRLQSRIAVDQDRRYQQADEMEWPDSCKAIEQESFDLNPITNSFVIGIREYETRKNEKESNRYTANRVAVVFKAKFATKMMNKDGRCGNKSQASQRIK